MKTSYTDKTRGTFASEDRGDNACLAVIRANSTDYPDTLNLMISAEGDVSKRSEAVIMVPLLRHQVIALRDFLSFWLDLPA